MKYIKKNKLALIIIIIAITILLSSFYSVARLLFPNMGKPVYGNRITNIEKHQINNDRKTAIINTLETYDKVNDADMNITGTIIKLFIDVKPGVDPNDAKNIGIKILNDFTDDEKGYYDIQIYISQETDPDSASYPIIGYKNKISSNLVWTGK
jgi:hypothetical protein